MSTMWLPAALFCVGCWAAAAAGAAAAGTEQDRRGPEYAPGRVLVRLRQTQPSGAGSTQGSSTAAASAAAAAGDVSLPPGLQLERLVGRHHTVRVPPPPAAKRLGAAAAGATSGSTGGTSSELPQDAVRLFRITDGSSVDAKLAELRAHPGAGCVSSLAAAAVALAGAHCTCTEPPCLAVADGLFHKHQPASAVLTAFLPACLPARFVAAGVEVAEPDYIYHTTALPQPAGAGVTGGSSSAIPQPVNEGPEMAAAAATAIPQALPDDSQYSDLWHMPQISAPQAWDTTTGSSQVCRCQQQRGRRAHGMPMAAGSST